MQYIISDVSNVLAVAALAAVIAAARLLPKYLERRVAEAARGAVDVSVGKTLETLRHSLASERERNSKDYSLFAESRNRVYAETYSLFQKSFGHYADHFASVTSYTDFRGSPADDLRQLAKALEPLSESERKAFRELIDTDLEASQRMANALSERASLRTANRAFAEFRNAAILHALYFSTALDAVLATAIKTLAPLSFYAQELIDEGEPARASVAEYRERALLIDKVDAIGAELRTLMRAEMQAGFQSRSDGVS